MGRRERCYSGGDRVNTRRRDNYVKLLRVLALVIGVAAAGVTGYRMFVAVRMAPELRFAGVWQQAFGWQRLLILLLGTPAGALRLRVIDYVQLGVHAGSVAVAVLLAPLLHRARLGWGLLSLLFPFVGPTVLGLRGSAGTGSGQRSGLGRLTELHVVALLITIAVLAATAYQTYVLIRVSPAVVRNPSLWGRTVFMWVRNDAEIYRYLSVRSLGIAGAFYLQLAFLNLYVPAIAVSIMMARALNRSRLDYAVLSAVFPYLAPLVLVFQSRRPSPDKGLIQGFFSALFSSTGQSGWVSQRKQCGRCGKQVSLAARAGQRCRHCGARWSAERTLRR